MIRVRAGEYHVMLRSGEVLAPYREKDLRTDEAYSLAGLGLVELLSAAPVVESATRSPAERRVPPVSGVGRPTRK